MLPLDFPRNGERSGKTVGIGVGASELLMRKGRKSLPIRLNVTTSTPDAKTAVMLSIAGSRRSLADGKYALILRADRILDGLERQLDGGADDSSVGDHIAQFRIVCG